MRQVQGQSLQILEGGEGAIIALLERTNNRRLWHSRWERSQMSLWESDWD